MTQVNDSEFTVYVTDDQLQSHCVLPGQPFPKGVTVTNPLVVGEHTDHVHVREGGAVKASPKPAAVKAKAPKVSPPPMSGKGSGRDKWADYAEAKGVEVGDDWNRDDILDELEARDIPTG